MENSVLSGAAQLAFADIEVQPLLIQHMMYFEEEYFQWFIFFEVKIMRKYLWKQLKSKL